MDIDRVSFESLANGGDDVTGALVKLDHNVQELADAVTDGDTAATALTSRVTAVEGKATDLDTRVTAAKDAASASQATADAALPKAGGAVTGSLSVAGTVTASGRFIAGGGAVQIGADGGSRATIDYQGTVTNSVGTSPGAVGGFSSFVLKANGAYGGGIGIKDGTTNIGLWSISGNLVIGMGDNDGAMTEQFRLNRAGSFQAKAYQCRAGSSGAYGVNTFNLMWGSGMSVYVDTSNVGTIQFSTSDYRIKSDVRRMESGALDRVLQWRPVTWLFKDGVGPWADDGKRRKSFIAHELAAVDRTLVSGEKDEVDADGNIVPQQLEPLAMLAELAGAVQELKRQNDDLRSRIVRLEGVA